MKCKLIALVAMITVGAVADFSIAWKSGNNSLGNSDFSALIGDGTYAALVWSSDAPPASPSSQELTLDGLINGSSEFLLASTTATTGGGFLFNAGESVTFGNADVGGANINNGYFYTRIFDTAVLADNNYYVQAQLVGNTLVDAGSPPNPGLVYSENVFTAPTYGQVDNQYTVIPEPATLGLMGVAGLGMFLARRKNRR